MIDLISPDAANRNSPDWRRSFNILNASQWHLLGATTSTEIIVPSNSDFVEVNGAVNIILSPDPITTILLLCYAQLRAVCVLT